jgi:hypothetical protein
MQLDQERREECGNPGAAIYTKGRASLEDKALVADY